MRMLWLLMPVLLWGQASTSGNNPNISGNPIGGGGGGGATNTSQLTDFLVARSSGTVATIGSACTVLLPCNVRYGNTTHIYTTGATVTITGGSGSGAVKMFVSDAGTLVVEHATVAGLTISCSGCTATQVTTPAFPANSIPLASLTVASGAWSTSITDERAFLSSRAITAGLGIVVTDGLGDAVVAIDPAQVAQTSGANVLTGSYDFSSATVTGISGGWTSAAGTFDYCVLGTCGADSGDNWVASRPYYQQIIIPGTITDFRYFAIRVGSAGSGNLAIALYDSSCNVVANTRGNTSATANTYAKITSTASQTLAPGIYYIGFSVEDSSSLIYGQAGLGPSLMNQGSALTHFYGSNAPTGSGGTFAMPNACGTRTSFGGGESAGVAFPSIRVAN